MATLGLLDRPHLFKKKFSMKLLSVKTDLNLRLTTLVSYYSSGRQRTDRLCHFLCCCRYHFHSLHFHWTSEHAINSQYYSLEAHFVLYNEKYNNMANAIKYQDGLEVVSTMFAVSLILTP